MRTNAFIAIFIATTSAFAGRAAGKDVAHHIQNARSEFEVAVYVAESGGTPPFAQKTAQSMVALLFNLIGVSVRFAGTEPPITDTEAIALRIQEHAPPDLRPTTLGMAWISRQPRQANVFRDRLMQFHEASSWSDGGQLLGYAIAHELGHILRADRVHLPAGIMKAYWKQSDIVPMLQGTLRFTRADVERIRAVMAERHREQLLFDAGNK